MTNLIRRGSEWLTYPFTVVTALVLHTTILASGIATFLSAYVPVLAAAGFITLLEIRRPYHRAWRPAAGTIKDDLLFMVLVQILVPRALALLIVLSLAAPQETLLVGGSFGWPHELSVAMQVVLMVLIADFFRYWLHRAAHHIPWLWRLHAVHHSPPGLYWLNTGRFHPFEKTLQFMADSVPFALLGVDERVLAAYFVFYAINGFFQHSNIKLRFGLLNYIISSAELHRWHHSRVSAESNRNFGNNIILWDLLFGTWYLPRRRRVPEVGLVNRKYPQGFLVQMLTPFTPQIAEREVPLMSLTQLVRGLALRAISVVIHWRYWRPFWHAAKTPRRTQDQVLADIVTTNANTKFGREHGFHEIRTYHDFKHRVPIQTYDSLRPYITRQMQTKHPDLTAAQPVMYGRTSGTTGNAKLIPVLNSTLTQYREQQNLFMYSQYRACPEAFLGQGLAIVSPAIEDRLDTGQPCGSVSGHIYKSMPRFIRANYVVPSEVFEISDYDRKYRVILRFALAERDITYLGGANPTSFLRLLEILNQCKHELVESLETGTFQALDGLPEGIRAPLAKRIVPDRARAARLKPLLYQTEITFADVWPGIRLLATWTAGSCGIALETLRHKLPEQTQILDLGFVSTEFRGTFAIDGRSGAGVPLLNQHFYEFCERENWDAGVAETVTAEKIEPGRDYYLIVTAENGLYRYFMNDIVRVTGTLNGVPLLKFVQKGKGVTNITGEKLYEEQVIQAVKSVEEELTFEPTFFMMLADEFTRQYELLIETAYRNIDKLAHLIDAKLAELNIEYRAKRQSGRLRPLKISALRSGAYEAYKNFCVANGQREGQFKTLLLQFKKDVRFPFDQYLEAGI